MGQRLVINIQKDSEYIAALYFHWSAHSVSALNETKEVLGCLEQVKDMSTKEIQLALIRFCENKGGCIDGGCDGTEYSKVQKTFPTEEFATSGSRSEGLIAISNEGIEDINSWGEFDIIVDMDTNNIINNVLYSTSITQYNRDKKELEGEDYKRVLLDDITEAQVDITCFKLSEIDNVINYLKSCDNVIRNGNTLYQLVE